MNTKLRILVIDDKQVNLDAAKEQLAGHQVTTASSFREAHKLLGQNKDADQYVYFDKQEPAQFDVVLTDLFMPACPDGINKAKFASHEGTEKPYGTVFALAALRRGIPMVAIVTSGNHHADPLVWALDLLGNDPGPYKIGSTTFFYANDQMPENKEYGMVLNDLIEASLKR